MAAATVDRDQLRALQVLRRHFGAASVRVAAVHPHPEASRRGG
jgi:hypothetical protein